MKWSVFLGTLIVVLLSACTAEVFQSDIDRRAQAAPWTHLEFNNNPRNFQFAVVGDRTGGARLGVFERAMTQINWLQPEFVVSVGDLIEGYSEDREQLRREWEELDRIVNQLQMPFFYVAGNHDIGNNVMQAFWRDRYGPDYYHFVYQDVLFLVVNTEDPPTPMSQELLDGIAYFKQLLKEDPAKAQALMQQSMEDGSLEDLELPTEISDQQLAYFEGVLADHKNPRWTIVLMHKPAWEYTHPNWPRLEALLADRDYTVVAGHNHYYNHSVRRGRDYIQMGTTGGSIHRQGPGTMDHVMWVTMTDSGPEIANIKLRGLLNRQGK